MNKMSLSASDMLHLVGYDHLVQLVSFHFAGFHFAEFQFAEFQLLGLYSAVMNRIRVSVMVKVRVRLGIQKFGIWQIEIRRNAKELSS